MKSLWTIICYTVYAGSKKGKTFRPASLRGVGFLFMRAARLKLLTPSTTFSYGTSRAKSAAGIGLLTKPT